MPSRPARRRSPRRHDVDNHTVNQYDIGTGGALTPKSTPTVPADLFPAAIAIARPAAST